MCLDSSDNDIEIVDYEEIKRIKRYRELNVVGKTQVPLRNTSFTLPKVIEYTTEEGENYLAESYVSGNPHNFGDFLFNSSNPLSAGTSTIARFGENIIIAPLQTLDANVFRTDFNIAVLTDEENRPVASTIRIGYPSGRINAPFSYIVRTDNDTTYSDNVALSYYQTMDSLSGSFSLSSNEINRYDARATNTSNRDYGVNEILQGLSDSQTVVERYTVRITPQEAFEINPWDGALIDGIRYDLVDWGSLSLTQTQDVTLDFIRFGKSALLPPATDGVDIDTNNRDICILNGGTWFNGRCFANIDAVPDIDIFADPTGGGPVTIINNIDSSSRNDVVRQADFSLDYVDTGSRIPRTLAISDGSAFSTPYTMPWTYDGIESGSLVGNTIWIEENNTNPNTPNALGRYEVIADDTQSRFDFIRTYLPTNQDTFLETTTNQFYRYESELLNPVVPIGYDDLDDNTGTAGAVLSVRPAGVPLTAQPNLVSVISPAGTAGGSVVTGGGGTVDTGSYATTGSNIFNGNQTINGDLIVTDDINIGNGTSITTGCRTLTVGNDLITAGENSVAFGLRARACSDHSFAHGIGLENVFPTSPGPIALGTGSHSEGLTTCAIGEASHAEGAFTVANAVYSHAEGQATCTTGRFSHAEGDRTRAEGIGSHAEGISTIAEGDYSHAEGFHTCATGAYQHVQGCLNEVGSYLTAVGNGSGNTRSNIFEVYTDRVNINCNANISNILSIGGITNVSESIYSASLSDIDPNRFATTGSNTFIGNQIITGSIDVNSDANIANNLAIGGITNVSQSIYNAVIGAGTNFATTGSNTFMGDQTIIGDLNVTDDINVSDNNSFLTGCRTLTVGNHVTASAVHAVAFGSGSVARGANPFAHGVNMGGGPGNISPTQAIGEGSHAEGISTIASGDASHAEGNVSFSIGRFSHAEGDSTRAIGQGSHSEGIGTCATECGQHAQGCFNATGSYLMGIGNGTTFLERSNIFEAHTQCVVISGSTCITNVMNLAPLDVLPTGQLGDLAVQGTELMFHNGTNWMPIS